ncbi:MAG: SIS domain-containing protein, partial [Gemmatimonadetes bacterium]|nr:SIS domain-containing protein [Gemmatimonadota bacterium]
MSAAEEYYAQTMERLQRLRDTQMDAIDKAAAICTESIANGGLDFLIGAG